VFLNDAPAEGGGEASLPFACLTALLLGGNGIDSWRSIDALDRFPSLVEVRINDNPLFQSQADNRYEVFFLRTQSLGPALGFSRMLPRVTWFWGGGVSNSVLVARVPSGHVSRLSIVCGKWENPHGATKATTTPCVVPSQVIARVGKLVLLNGGEVASRERRDCEIRYLREVLGERWSPASGHARSAA
jgi:hypothetical protein